MVPIKIYRQSPSLNLHHSVQPRLGFKTITRLILELTENGMLKLHRKTSQTPQIRNLRKSEQVLKKMGTLKHTKVKKDYLFRNSVSK